MSLDKTPFKKEEYISNKLTTYWKLFIETTDFHYKQQGLNLYNKLKIRNDSTFFFQGLNFDR